MERSGEGENPNGPAGPTDSGGPAGLGRAGHLTSFGDLGDLGGPSGTGSPGGPGDPGGAGGAGDAGEPGGLPLPLLPGFREMALRRMAAERRRLVEELAGPRQAAPPAPQDAAGRA